MLTMRLEAKRERKIAVSTPIGTPSTSAPVVTYKLPRIIGSMP